MPELTGSAVAGGASESEKRFLWEGSKLLAHGGWGESGKVGGGWARRQVPRKKLLWSAAQHRGDGRPWRGVAVRR